MDATLGYSAGMRIELPSTSWADTVQRAEEDAHTLTVAAQPLTEWPAATPFSEAALTVRTEVAGGDAVELTLTF
jgi:hypothetical protein